MSFPFPRDVLKEHLCKITLFSTNSQTYYYQSSEIKAKNCAVIQLPRSKNNITAYWAYHYRISGIALPCCCNKSRLNLLKCICTSSSPTCLIGGETTCQPNASGSNLLLHSNDNKARYLFQPEYEPLSRCAGTSPGHRLSCSRKTRSERLKP